MLIKRYLCSMMNVDYVELPDGDKINSVDAAENAKVYGMYVISGEYIVGDRRFAAGTGFIPNDIDYPATAQAVGDAVWFCFSQNDDTRRTVSVLTIDGSAQLPANHGFFVIQGTVEADGKTATQNQFFRPRNVDLEIIGDGIIATVA